MKNMSFLILVFCIAIAMLPPQGLASGGAEDIALTAPDGTTVDIKRDEYGVPHIFGETEVGVFFGQGFAIAQDRMFQLEQFRRAARGETARLLGAGQVEFDKQVRTMYYTEAERLQHFNALAPEHRAMLEAYRDGINTYVDSMNVNPAKYRSKDFMLLGFERWKVTDTIAIMQFLIRQFGAFGGHELDRLSELQQNGQAWLDENRPINEPDLPTTILGGGANTVAWHYSGLTVDRQVVKSIAKREQRFEAARQRLNVPGKWGSFAVLITPEKSDNGMTMLLGCPQMGEPQFDETQTANEVELSCPTLHVGGMTLAGAPGVIIGRNEYFAWSLTSGNTDNIDVYIETTQDTTFGKYLFNGEWRDFEVIQDTIEVLFSAPVVFTHYRTVHGPVFAEDLANKQVYTKKMTFWNDELGMLESINGFYRVKTLEEFEAAAARNPMSFNLFYAGKDMNVKYWHVGRYQDRSDGVDPRLPHKGDGTEEWGGFLDFSQLPVLQNPPRGYLVNWNNKPAVWWNNGDNVPYRHNTDSTSATWRVLRMERFVGPTTPFSYEHLKDVPRQIRSHGTYQQAIAFSETASIDENILPPGQSEFVSLTGVPSPHKNDQWELHMNWQFKDMLFGVEITSGIAEDMTPKVFSLSQNYPNPFNPATTISYSLAQKSRVSIKIYNVQGQWVQTLVEKQQEAGFHQVIWDARGMSSGLYFYQITAGDFSAVRKAMVVK